MTKELLRRRRVLAAALAAPLAGAMQRAFAQSKGWPDRPIKLVLGYPPGGAADGTSRPLEPKLQSMLGQPILFDYRPGAGATVAADYTARAAPDGYTLHIIDAGPMTILPNGKQLDYDPFKSFTPIGMVCAGGTLVAAHPSVAAGNVKELIAMLKEKPGSLSYGTSGIGGAGHLAAELFQSMTGTRMVHVPYKGGNQAVTDLVGGQIPLLFSSMTTAIPYVQSQKIKAIAVTFPTRASALPETPTVAESGLPGFDASVWFAMVGPAKLPEDIVSKVNQALNAALAEPGVQDSLRRQGYEPVRGSAADLARQIRSDYEKWGKVIREAKISFA
ncbi:MAG TPA: tripartite tricarboxylate transporter substrate binding protein [Lautropia sp.]|nr:tripartite tricarboxylate transporter substrate binding protein [Lautropia sp.]